MTPLAVVDVVVVGCWVVSAISASMSTSASLALTAGGVSPDVSGSVGDDMVGLTRSTVRHEFGKFVRLEKIDSEWAMGMDEG